MKISFHYLLCMFVLATLLCSHAFISDGFSENKAIIVEELSESRIIAEDNNGEVDDLLAKYSSLLTDFYLTDSILLIQRNNISEFTSPNRARAPPFV